jgi:hypothetical protein
MNSSEKAATITVIQAVYGAVQGSKDVTEIVQDIVNKGKNSFVANNTTLGPDPAPGHDKHFAMNYTVGSSSFAFACKENETVILQISEAPPPKPSPIKVIAAAYGAINKDNPSATALDVTAVVQAVLDIQGTKEVKFTPSNGLLGDPLPGPRKNFGMIYAPADDLSPKTAIASDEDQQVTIKIP